MNIEEFNVLVECERNLLDSAEAFLHMGHEQFNNVCTTLENAGYIKAGNITDLGRKALEPYRVKRAIFMAAGFGSRMVPLTYTIPKPLVSVNGTRIIETLLDAVIQAGIEDIVVVRGYMKEAFSMLLEKYPMIKFVDNMQYNEANNISSAYVIRSQMEHAYVIESDLVLYNPRVIRKYEYHTNYLGRKTNETDDWCFKVVDGIITELLIGGTDVYHMYGISYWDETDAKKMEHDIESVFFNKDGKQKYWDEVSMRDCKDNYHIYVKPVYEGDIIEIDTYEELGLIDKHYYSNSN